MYVVKLYDQSPFNMDSLGKDMFILCNKKTGEPVAEIGNELPWYVKPGDVIKEGDVKFEQTSKKLKYIVKGDTIEFGLGLFGILEKIETGPHDDFWGDILHLKDCRAKSNEAYKALTGMSVDENTKIERSKCKHKPYMKCEFEISEERKWDKIEQAWIDFKDGYSPSFEQVMQFWKEKVKPK